MTKKLSKVGEVNRRIEVYSTKESEYFQEISLSQLKNGIVKVTTYMALVQGNYREKLEPSKKCFEKIEQLWQKEQ